jgi:hypothetical protein
MAERKQRINIMLQQSTLAKLEQEKPKYQRSEYIDQLIRKDMNMNAVEVKTQGFAVYTKSIDHGQGVHTVYVKDGKIVKQFLGSVSELYHSYTGGGNPEWIGQDVSVLRGNGFKRLRNKNRLEEIEDQWMESEVEG